MRCRIDCHIMSQKRWLSLTHAAEQLDVHPSTLRRWADNGSISVMITPGGHRRFDATEIDQFAESQKVRSAVALQEIWTESAIAKSRQEIKEQPDKKWLTGQSRESRTQHRVLGQRLVGLVMQYVAAEDSVADDLLDDAKQVGQAYAQIGQSVEMPLTEILQASMTFHETMLETSLELPEKARIRPETNRRLLKRINRILNTVHLSIVGHYESYDHASR